MRKTIFIAFAKEDENIRDFLKGQARNNNSPFDFIDMSVKDAYKESEWKEKVRTRIRRSDGVLVVVSKNSPNSKGQKWEIKCAIEEGKPIRGIRAHSEDLTDIEGILTMYWTWDDIANWINSLS